MATVQQPAGSVTNVAGGTPGAVTWTCAPDTARQTAWASATTTCSLNWASGPTARGGIGPTILGGPGCGWGAKIGPSILGAAEPKKVRYAMVGVGGRGAAHLGWAGEGIVALCDVDAGAVAKAAKRHPNAKKYKDYRKMFEDADDFDR